MAQQRCRSMACMIIVLLLCFLGQIVAQDWLDTNPRGWAAARQALGNPISASQPTDPQSALSLAAATPITPLRVDTASIGLQVFLLLFVACLSFRLGWLYGRSSGTANVGSSSATSSSRSVKSQPTSHTTEQPTTMQHSELTERQSSSEGGVQGTP